MLPLSGLSVAGGTLSPAFTPDTTVYTATLPVLTPVAQLTPTAAAGVTVEINGVPVASGSASAPIAVGSQVVMIPITVRVPGQPDKTYSVAVMRAPSDYLKASNTGAQNSFGSSVALSGDTLVVGAPGESSDAQGVGGDQTNVRASGSGAAYVFVRTSAGWTQQAYLKASNTAAGAMFGSSVTLSGDTLAVGSYMEGVGGASSGAVYVFQRTGTTWAQQAYLKGISPRPSDFFGASVALAGDTLAVGAYGEAGNARGINMTPSLYNLGSSGAVFVFQRSGTAWNPQAYIKASNAATGADFGSSVALAGDTLAVGAFGDSSGSGAAYVYQRTGTTWAEQAALKASNPGMGNVFGYIVAVSGDTLAVGSYQESGSATGINNPSDTNATGSGAVYVFQRSGTAWTQQAYVKASNTGIQDSFGLSVALDGDVLAVGATGESSSASGLNGDQSDNSSNTAGAVYLFQRTGVTWAQRAYIKASNPYPNARFGRSVALSPGTLASGSSGDPSNARGVNGSQLDRSLTNAGAVYVFR